MCVLAGKQCVPDTAAFTATPFLNVIDFGGVMGQGKKAGRHGNGGGADMRRIQCGLQCGSSVVNIYVLVSPLDL